MDSYKLKYVRFLGREVPIVVQSENGPCPLLAIANVLLLRDAIRMPANTYEIEQERLMAILAEYLLDINPVEPNSNYAANLQQNLQDVISNMHKLMTGVDVNPKFSSVRGFEFTNETAIFDLFDISLVHGWIMDPEDDVAASVGEMSYNQVVGKLISKLGAASLRHVHVPEPPLIDLSTDATPSQETLVKCDLVLGDDGLQLKLEFEQQPLEQKTEEKIEEPSTDQTDVDLDVDVRLIEIQKWEAVRNWLDSNSSQLSAYGLYQLHQQLPVKELAVFFRNNHFNTIFKERNALYLLVTDQGYLSESDLVWEKLESVNNDNQFYNGAFKPFERAPEPPPPASDHDLQYALAMSMSLQNNDAPPSSVLPRDFLSVSPTYPPQQSHTDSDLALAIQLQEEENLQHAQTETTQSQWQQANNPRIPQRRGGGHYSQDGYPQMSGRQARATSAQHAFPPTSGYGTMSLRPSPAYHMPDYQPSDARPRRQNSLPVSQSGDYTPPPTWWGRIKRYWKLRMP